jgi:hypothetical protein
MYQKKSKTIQCYTATTAEVLEATLAELQKPYTKIVLNICAF